MTKTQPPDLPQLWPALLYLAFGALCFGLALAGAARYAQDFTGFYYHPHILALTHLVTLGWITGNILGSLYLIAPMSLRLSLPSGRCDHGIFVIFVVGVAGMVSHFWIRHDSGMAWSAGMVYAALVSFAIKLLRAIRRSGAPSYVIFHIRAALVNLLLAAGLGLAVAINKVHAFLPTTPSANILAHMHMAAIGWTLMLVFGVAYRLIPMFVPGEPAKGLAPWISGLLLETGVLGLFAALLTGSSYSLPAGILICAGIAVFLLLAARTIRRRKRTPPPEPPRPDFTLLQLLFSFLCLACAAAAGILLTRLPTTPRTLQLALAYGFVGLVGFLGQIVVAMKPRIFSILSWYYASSKHANDENKPNIPRPIDMPVRSLQAFTLVLWVAGVFLFPAGVLLEARLPILAGAVSLLSALLISTIHELVILRRVFQ